jgi:hypothetical protein
VTGEAISTAVMDALTELGAAWMVVGSLSTNYYGIPRSTKDADFVVRFDGVSVTELMRRLGPDFRLDQQAGFELVTATVRYRIDHPAANFQIELFMLSDDPHEQQRFARRVEVQMFGRTTFVPTAEDCIITKLRWLRDAGRGKDEDDVRNVIVVRQPSLDWPYIHRWCDQHGTRPLLDRILASIPA